jgi:hypothetical protein
MTSSPLRAYNRLIAGDILSVDSTALNGLMDFRLWHTMSRHELLTYYASDVCTWRCRDIEIVSWWGKESQVKDFSSTRMVTKTVPSQWKQEKMFGHHFISWGGNDESHDNHGFMNKLQEACHMSPIVTGDVPPWCAYHSRSTHTHTAPPIHMNQAFNILRSSTRTY